MKTILSPVTPPIIAMISNIVDAHGHFYHCYEASKLVDAINLNIYKLPEVNGDYFVIHTRTGTEDSIQTKLKQTSATLCGKSYADGSQELVVAGRTITIIPGVQIKSKERLEIQLIGDLETEKFEGLAFERIVAQLIAENFTLIFPWGVGKWLGSRGKLLTQALKTYPSRIFLSDSSLRPRILPSWILSHYSELSAGVLAGSDGLPIKGQESTMFSLASLFTSPSKFDRSTDLPTKFIMDAILNDKVVQTVGSGRSSISIALSLANLYTGAKVS